MLKIYKNRNMIQKYLFTFEMFYSFINFFTDLLVWNLATLYQLIIVRKLNPTLCYR